MVVTNDRALAERCRSLKNLGFNRERRFLHDAVGFNYRMTNLQAAIGLAQLERIDEYVERRRAHARRYNELLRHVAGGTPPVERPRGRHPHWRTWILADQ